MKKKKIFLRKSMRKNKGITLIALVITIVVLIILATISISSVLRRKWVDKKGAGNKRNV